MTAFLNFLNMGGYGMYVWPAYGLVLGLLTLQLFLPWRQLRKRKQRQKAADAET